MNVEPRNSNGSITEDQIRRSNIFSLSRLVPISLGYTQYEIYWLFSALKLPELILGFPGHIKAVA